MPIDVIMPQLGESVTEGTIVHWLKQPGETVAQYEALLEIITDKVGTEITAPVDGTVLALLVEEGVTVPVGTLIARLTPHDEASETPEQNASSVWQSGTVRRREESAAPPPISPVVARLAGEHAIDLSQITGSGANGRVTKRDVERYLLTRNSPVLRPLSGTHTTRPTQMTRGGVVVPLSPMRRTIAEHMDRSQRVPQATTVMEVDLARVVAHRAWAKGNAMWQGVRLTYTAYIVESVAQALVTVPHVNASYRDDGILIHDHINIGIAVALPDGLLVPVIRDADKLNLSGLAHAIDDLASRARTRQLRMDETQGGTFTLTNHGVSGSIMATPMLHDGQAAIIGIGAIEKRAVVVSDNGTDAIAIRPRSYLSLTFDHRVLDGALADLFLRTVKDGLESYGATDA